GAERSARAGHPGHHPLPTTARLPPARSGAHPDRRAHRGLGWARAGAPAGEGRLRSMALGTPGPVDVDVTAVRKKFPILERKVTGHRLVSLDSASSSQKPISVIEAMSNYYETTHANVHRGVYAIAEEATRLYELARAKVARFIGAPSSSGVVFTKNITE